MDKRSVVCCTIVVILKIIRANTSHPGLVSNPEFIGFRMPGPGSHETEKGPGSSPRRRRLG